MTEAVAPDGRPPGAGRTPADARRPRRARGVVRAWASLAGVAAFLAPAAALARSPEPPIPAEAGRVQVIRRIVRRIVVVHERPEAAPVRYVAVGGGSSSGGAPVTTTRGS